MADTKEESIGGGVDSSMSSGGPRGSVLARPRLVAVASSTADSLNRPSSAGTFHVDTSNIFNSTKSVLRPSQLKASNPFSRISSESGDTSKPSSSSGLFLSGSSTSTSDTTTSSSGANNSDANTATDKNINDAPKFVPLHSSRDSISFAGSTASRASPSGLIRASGFVFGQNLQDRIVKQPDDESGEGPSEHSATNGTSHLFFSAAVKASADQFTKETTGTLAESAEAWERARDIPQPPAHPPGPIFTGEEDETNILQVNCKLFAFEGGIWKERGHGQLRLNDGASSSRLVCRAAGSLRVLLNTKVFADMNEEKVGSKYLRVTATDSKQQLKVFLIMASPEEINQLHKYVSIRVTMPNARLASAARDDAANAPSAVSDENPLTPGVQNSENPSHENAAESQSPTDPTPEESVPREAVKRPLDPSLEDEDEAKKQCVDASQL